MKCRACWADKAYVREVAGWRGAALSWFGIVPLKCHHCYHKSLVPWFLTFGKQLNPPARKPASAHVASVTPRKVAAENATAAASCGGRQAA